MVRNKWLLSASLILIAGCDAHLGAGSRSEDGETAASKSDSDPGDGDSSSDPFDPNCTVNCIQCEDTTASSAPIRRLSEAEYKNAVESLLGVSVSDIELAADTRSGPFATNRGTPVSVPSALSYMENAELVSELALRRLAELVPCDEPEVTMVCAESFVASFARLAYRRALTEEEQGSLSDFLRIDDDVQSGLRRVIERVLQSPHFLYLVERSEPGAGELARLDSYSIANKLASFLWNSIPDEALLNAAESGQLDTSEGVAAQAELMMSDPKAVESFVAFFDQWFETDLVLEAPKDTEAYPAFNHELAEAMRQETHQFVRWMIANDSFTYPELLLSSKAFPGEALSGFYGVPNASTDQAVDLPHRVGLLTHPSVTASHAKLASSAIVGRGEFLLEALLCETLPEPPADVEALIENIDSSLPQRERLAQHREDPSCANCHVLIDPLGASLEHFGAIGEYRTEDELGLPVDASGTLVGTSEDGEFDDVRGLMERIVASEEGVSCAVEQWMRFAQRRLSADGDVCSLHEAKEAFVDSGHDFNALVRSIVTSDSFLFHNPSDDSAGVDQ